MSADAEGLAAGTGYHYRVIATNPGGTSTGSTANFTTLPKPPTVTTGTASSVTATTAVLYATVNPGGGEVTSCTIEYGTSLPSGTTVPCTPSPGSGTSPVEVSATASNLTVNTSYQYRVIATNPGGTSTGSTANFTTLPKPPAVTTGTASSVTATTAVLNATVNPNGSEVGACTLEYGLTADYGSSATCSPPPGSGSSPEAVSASIAGLSAHATYHFRVVASNAGGTGYGSDEAFSTRGTADYGTCAKTAKVDGHYLGGYDDKGCTTENASGEGKYEWAATPEGSHIAIAGKTKSVTLRSALRTIVCKASTSEGEITGPSATAAKITFSGCATEQQACTSLGEPTGSIKTGVLDGSLLEPEPGIVWTQYRSSTPPRLAEFECGAVDYAIKGTIAGVDTCDVEKMTKSGCETFAEGAGDQGLELEIVGGASEPLVEIAVAKVKCSEKIEIRTS